MAVVSLSIGLLFSACTKVIVTIAVSVMILIVSGAYSGFSSTWDPFFLAIKAVVLIQIGYVIGAMAHASLHKHGR